MIGLTPVYIHNMFRSGFEGFEAISDSLIRYAEKILGKTLPDSYKSLLETRNGGYLARNAFPTEVQNHSGEGYIPVDSIFGISRDLDESNGILITDYMTREWRLPGNLVLLDGDGHTWIALDYRSDAATPSVTFLDIEMEQEIVLASTFQKFIDGLIEEPD